MTAFLYFIVTHLWISKLVLTLTLNREKTLNVPKFPPELYMLQLTTKKNTSLASVVKLTSTWKTTISPARIGAFPM